MRPFEYLKPKTLEEACAMLSEHKEEAKILAGGQNLVLLLRQRLISPQYVIDIKDISGLDYVDESSDGVRIGALTTHRTIETSRLINKKYPILAEMERVVGSVQVRNWGTIGGNLAHADPSSDPVPALIALGARVKAVSVRGEREMGLEEFCLDYFQTALEADEILKEISVPRLASNSGGVYIKESVREGDFGIVTVAVLVTMNGNQTVKEARIVLGAQSRKAIRAKKAESMVIGKKVGDELKEAGIAASKEADPVTDINGSEEYKRELTRVLVRDSVAEAIKRAHNGLKEA